MRIHWIWLLPAVLLFEITFRPIGDPDLYFYFALVREYLANGAWPTTDPFLHTLPNAVLVSAHQWLGYFSYYLPYTLLGWAGPIALKSLLAAALFCVPLWPFLRARISPPLMFAGLWTLAIFAGHHRLRERVSLWGDFFVTALAAGLLWGAHRRAFWLSLPLLFLVWAQLHPSYPLGWVLLGLYLVTHPARAREWPALMGTALAIAMPVFNPAGWDGYVYPIQFARTIQPYLQQHVMEWLPLWDERLYPYLFLYVPLLTLVPWIAARLIPSGTWFERALAVLAVTLMVKSVRFGLLGHGLLLCTLASVETRAPRIPARLWTAFALLAGLSAAAVKISTSPYLFQNPTARIDVSRDYAPVEAAETLQRLKPRLPLFNSFAYGGYLAWAWGGDPKLFFHGFSTDFEFYQTYYLEPQESREALDRMIAKFDLGVFVLAKDSTDGAYLNLLASHPQWQVVWQNANSVIFAKRDPRVFEGGR